MSIVPSYFASLPSTYPQQKQIFPHQRLTRAGLLIVPSLAWLICDHGAPYFMPAFPIFPPLPFFFFSSPASSLLLFSCYHIYSTNTNNNNNSNGNKMSSFLTSTRPLAANGSEDAYLAVLVGIAETLDRAAGAFDRTAGTLDKIAGAIEKLANQKPDAQSTWASLLMVGVFVAVVSITGTWYVAKYHSNPPTTTSTPNSADPPKPEDEGGLDLPSPTVEQVHPAESSTLVLDNATPTVSGGGKKQKKGKERVSKPSASAVMTRSSSTKK